MKIVINSCFGGFGLSHEAVLRYAEIKGIKLYIEKSEWGFYSYYLVPKEEYDKAEEESLRSCGNYKEVNEKNLYFSDRDIKRNDPVLIQVIEELKESASGDHAKLKIIEIPDDVDYEIDEYDGLESVHEKHRTWS